MSTLRTLLVERAQNILEKKAFQPMPGGQPPADPNAQQGMDPSMMQGGGQGMPMDPSMMQQGGMPMDPSMMQQGGMPMDPSMMGMGGMPMAPAGPPPATVGQLSITDFQTMMIDMLSNVLPQIIQQLASAGEPELGAEGMPSPEQAPQEDTRAVSNTEISEKLDALMAMLAGAAGGGAAPEGLPPPAPGEVEGLGFGGQAVGGMPPAQGQMPMEVQASEQPKRQRNKLADLILSKTARARKG